MIKLLFFSLFLTVSSFSSAFAYERCGMPTGHACANFYSRLEAFKTLNANENNIDEAKENLKLVEDVQKRFKLNLQYVVENFVYVQKAVGGANATRQAQQSFRLLVKELSDRNHLHELADMFVSIVIAENDINDAQENFSLIAGYARSHRIYFTEGTKLFVSILRMEGGANSTLKAQQTFHLLLKQSNKYSLNDLLDSYGALLKAENTNEDAVKDFNLVLLAAEKCADLMRATYDFLEVLNQVGGYNKTLEAQKLYRYLYEI